MVKVGIVMLWHAFWCLQILHLSKKNNLRMSRAGFPSSIVTVEHSCVLDIIVEKFLPPPHSSHLHMFRRQFRGSVKSSAIALDSRIRLNCVHSSKARLDIHARIDSQHCLSLFVLLRFSSTKPSKYLRWGEWFFTFKISLISGHHLNIQYCNKIN